MANQSALFVLKFVYDAASKCVYKSLLWKGSIEGLHQGLKRLHVGQRRRDVNLVGDLLALLHAAGRVDKGDGAIVDGDKVEDVFGVASAPEES